MVISRLPNLFENATYLSLVCTTAFYQADNLANALQVFMANSFDARPTAFVKGVRVKTLHLGYRKTVKSVTNLTPRQHKFTTEDMGEVDVATYFRRSLWLLFFIAFL